MNRPPEHTLQKVVIQLPADDWHGYASETLWGEDLGGGRFRLRNVPFHARGMSAEDIVMTRPGPTNPEISGVLIYGGHSTYRIFLAEQVSTDSDAFREHWRLLEAAGCTYERASERLFAVDVPPGANIHEVYHHLEDGAAAGVWDFEEGHCGHVT